MDAWATHLPVLAACVRHTTGAVLELGCGDYSTPLLHALCPGRLLVSVESKAAWLQRYAALEADKHRLACHSDVRRYASMRWDVVFVDNEPGQLRVPFMRDLRHAARLFVVHDTEPGRPVYRFDELLPSFPHRFDYSRWDTRTSVVSDNDPLDWLPELLP